MIDRLTAYSLRHRPIVLALLVLFVFAGVTAFQRLPIEAYPDVTNVQIQIITLFPGHAAEEVEKLITVPVENEMNGIPKRVTMRSISIFGLSVVTIIFEDGTQGDYVRSQAFQHLQAITLPLGITSSKEYAELEWPIDILIAVVWVAYAVVFFGTVARRRVKHM